MAQPYVGEIKMFAGNFAPVGWMFCNGQTLPISEEYDTLFQLIGTTYGGDGESTFALPNLSSRIPIHMGAGAGDNYILGQMAGTESVTLTVPQIPQHTHAAVATQNTATSFSPANQVLAATTGATTSPYGLDAPFSNLSTASMTPAGGSQPHENMQPFLCVNFIISLFGLFPSQT